MAGATRARIVKAVETGAQLYQQTGSVSAVATYYRKFAAKKIPLLITHLRQLRRRKAIAEQIVEARSHDSRPQIAIKVTGGIGDMLVIARFMRDLTAHVEDVVFDVYASIPERAPWAFGNIPGYRATYADIAFESLVSEYDAGMWLCQFAILYGDHLKWKTIRQYSKLAKTVANIIRYRSKIDVYVSHSPWMDNDLARRAVFAGYTRRDYLHHMAKIPYGGDEFEIPTTPDAADVLAKHGLRGRRYLTVHNGHDPSFIVAGKRATKCYPAFDRVIERVKQEMPDLTVVQVGTSTSTSIPSADINLVEQTTFNEVTEIIRHSTLHADNEGGLVHLAKCLGVRSCVVFGPTPAEYFGYDGNINVAPPVCGGCWWIDRTWMDRCHKGYDEPLCMSQQDPDHIASLIVGALEDYRAEAVSRQPRVPA